MNNFLGKQGLETLLLNLKEKMATPFMVDFDVALMGGDEDTNLTFELYSKMIEAWEKHRMVVFKYDNQYYRVFDYNMGAGVDKWLCMFITAENHYPSTLTLNVNTGVQLENSYPYSFYSSNLGSVATTIQDGLMSAGDKIKLDNITSGNVSIVTKDEYLALEKANALSPDTVYYIK